MNNIYWLIQCALIAGLVICPVAVKADQAQYIYDDLGRLQAVIDGQGNTAIYTYDAVGNLLSITRRAPGQLSVLGVTPVVGAVGTPVTIHGLGFAATSSDDHVTFSGGATAVVQSATADTITTTVPDGAVTGPIIVMTPAGTDATPQPFVVLPTITAIAPAYGFQGTTITSFLISGTNFEGSTTVAFTPSTSITVTNPPAVSADGKSATVEVSIGATAPLDIRVVTIGNADGASSDTVASENSFLILPNQPLVAVSRSIGVYVEPSSAETFGSMVLAPYVGVQTAP